MYHKYGRPNSDSWYNPRRYRNVSKARIYTHSRLFIYLFIKHVCKSIVYNYTPVRSLTRERTSLPWVLKTSHRKNREFQMSLQRRQRERQKGNRLRMAKQQLCPSYFFAHFFAVTARLRREMPNFTFIDIVNIRRRISLSLFIGYS